MYASGTIDFVCPLLALNAGRSDAPWIGRAANSDERRPPRMGWAEGCPTEIEPCSRLSLSRSSLSSPLPVEVSTEANSVWPVKHGIYGLAKHEFADWRAID